MTNIVVGARFEVASNQLVAAAKATREEMVRLEDAAKKAAEAIDRAANAGANADANPGWKPSPGAPAPGGSTASGGGTGGRGTLDLFGPGGGKAAAAEIAEVEAALGRYMAKIDPASRAVKTQVEGQELLSRAYQLGIVSQRDYELAMGKVTAAAEKQRIAGDSTAKEIEKVEAALARYMLRIDPASKAVRTQVEGQALFNQALKLGLIDQAQYEAGMAKVTKAAEQQRLTVDNLTKGKLRFGEAMKFGATALAGLVGGLVGSVATMALAEGASALLNLAYTELWKKTDSVTQAHELFNKVLNAESALAPKIAQSARERADAYLAEQRNLESLTAARVADLKVQLAQLSSAQGRTGVLGPLGIALGPALELQIARVRDAIRAGEEAEAIALGRQFDEDIHSRGRLRGIKAERDPFSTGGGPGLGKPKPARGGTGGRRGASIVERELLREAEAAIKAKRALDEYGEASQDIIDKAAAEFTGRRELIAQIELEAQLRKKYGVEFVEQNKTRIQALAAERAAAQRVAEQYKATARLVETTTQALGDVMHATLELSLDRSAEAVQRWEDTFIRAIRNVAARLQELAIINPIINAITGKNDLPTAYGEGGLFSQLGKLVGGLFGGGTGGVPSVAYGATYHEGGIVGRAAGQMKCLPSSAWAMAPRAHQGMQLGPRERPIVALEGEGIFTPRAMNNADNIVRALVALLSRDDRGGGNVTIIDQRGAGAPPMERQQRRGAGGRLDTVVIVKRDWKQAAADGAFDGVMQQRYGIVPRGGRGG